MSNKKRCTTLTMEDRLSVLEDLNASQSISIVALKYNVDESTIRRIKKNAPKIMEFADKTKVQKKRQRLKRSVYEELEERLLTWFRERKTLGAPISDALISEKATELKGSIESCANFKVSPGWLSGFKKRHNIRLVKPYKERETAPPNEDGAKKFVENFQKLIEEEDVVEENIYNMDQTGLLWRALPSKALVEEKEKFLKVYKSRKEHVTVALCANASGTHKLMPLVMNKYENPEALKDFKLPIIFKTQSNAWMTQPFFINWYENVFKPSVRAHQAKNSIFGKVILLLDNCRGYKVPREMLESEDFKIMYLPQNTSSLIQPMGQGIMSKFKKLYRYKTLRRAATCIGELHNFHKFFTIIDCLELLNAAWGEVTADNIQEAWKKIIPEQRDMYLRTMKHDISFFTGETVSEEDIIQFISSCEEVENKRSIEKENEVANGVTGDEKVKEEEQHQEIVVGWNESSRDELNYLLQRLGQHVSREVPFMQQIFQVFKNHFLGIND